MQPALPEDPLVGLLQAFPCGVLLLRDSLAASGHFLLPWLTSAALGQGHKVCLHAAAAAVVAAAAAAAVTIAISQAFCCIVLAICVICNSYQPHQQSVQVDGCSCHDDSIPAFSCAQAALVFVSRLCV
jgi:hypothetical protein